MTCWLKGCCSLDSGVGMLSLGFLNWSFAVTFRSFSLEGAAYSAEVSSNSLVYPCHVYRGYSICNCAYTYKHGTMCRYANVSKTSMHCSKSQLLQPSLQEFIGLVVKMMVPFWVPIIVRHLLFRVPKKGPSL